MERIRRRAKRSSSTFPRPYPVDPVNPVYVSSFLSSSTRLNVAARCSNSCRPERSVKMSNLVPAPPGWVQSVAN